MAKKILIVDDAYTMRNLLKQIIRETDYQVVGEAKDGLEGVKLFEELKPDLVIMDIKMPVKDGIEASKEILSRFPYAKILIITGQSKPGLKEEVLEMGAVDFLKKPFQPAFVWSRLDAIFAKVDEAILKDEVMLEADVVVEEDSMVDVPVVEEEAPVEEEFELFSEPQPVEEIVIRVDSENIVIPDDSFDDAYYERHKLSQQNVEREEREEQLRLEREAQERAEREEQERLKQEEQKRHEEQLRLERAHQEQLRREELKRLEHVDIQTSLEVGKTTFESTPAKTVDEIYVRPPRKMYNQDSSISDDSSFDDDEEPPVLNPFTQQEQASQAKGFFKKIKDLLGR